MNKNKHKALIERVKTKNAGRRAVTDANAGRFRLGFFFFSFQD